MKPPVKLEASHKIAVRLFTPRQTPPRAKILLLKLDHIGDFVVATNAFRIIREAFADAEITLICLPGVVSLAESMGLFDKVRPFAFVPASAQMGKTEQTNEEEKLSQFKALLEEPYFLAADFRHDPFNRYGLDHVEAEYSAAFMAKTQKGLHITLPLMEWDAPAGAVAQGKHLPVHAEIRMNLLAHIIVDSLGREKFIPGPFMPPEKITTAEIYDALQAVTQFRIGVSLGAGSTLRKWKKDYWIQLLHRLVKARDAHIVFFGGLEDKEDTATVIAALPAARVTDLTSRMPLSEVPAYMKLLNAYIGCDTGLTHLAANLGVPTVNIFAGISNLSVWRARGAKVKSVYAEVACAPCHLRFKEQCPNNNVCMGVIVPEIVYACFEQVLV